MMSIGSQEQMRVRVKSATGPILSSQTACSRCGGLLVGERCMEMGEHFAGSCIWVTRCIQCGDVLDELIRERRKLRTVDPLAFRAAS